MVSLLVKIHPTSNRFSQEIHDLRHCHVARLLMLLYFPPKWCKMIQSGPSPPFTPKDPQRHRHHRSAPYPHASHASAASFWRPPTRSSGTDLMNSEPQKTLFMKHLTCRTLTKKNMKKNEKHLKHLHVILKLCTTLRIDPQLPNSTLRKLY